MDRQRCDDVFLQCHNSQVVQSALSVKVSPVTFPGSNFQMLSLYEEGTLGISGLREHLHTLVLCHNHVYVFQPYYDACLYSGL